MCHGSDGEPRLLGFFVLLRQLHGAQLPHEPGARTRILPRPSQLFQICSDRDVRREQARNRTRCSRSRSLGCKLLCQASVGVELLAAYLESRFPPGRLEVWMMFQGASASADPGAAERQVLLWQSRVAFSQHAEVSLWSRKSR